MPIIGIGSATCLNCLSENIQSTPDHSMGNVLGILRHARHPKRHLAGWSQAQIDAMFPKTSFLELPAEIRYMIYELALGDLSRKVTQLGYVDCGTYMDLSFPVADSVRARLALPSIIAQPVSKQFAAEAQYTFWNGANFFVTVVDDRRCWFDRSAPFSKHVPYVPAQSICNMTVVIRFADYEGVAQSWLKTRMTYRKNCVFFGQFPALKRLKVAIVLDGDNDRSEDLPGTCSFAADADLPGLDDIVIWLLRGIPRDVELRWITLPPFGPYTYPCLDPKRLHDLETQFSDMRSTSIGVPKKKRNPKPPGVEPAFLKAWTDARRAN